MHSHTFRPFNAPAFESNNHVDLTGLSEEDFIYTQESDAKVWIFQ